MPIRAHIPDGAPCWADLWTSDVEGSRRFYGEILGWEADPPNPEFGGYFMFNRRGVPVAGGMGDMPGMAAQNRWRIYLTTDDAARTVERVQGAGGQVAAGATPVADLGFQAVFADSTGADLGAWQPGTFPGFTVLGEPGAPSWFELHTRDFAAALGFYRSVFRWDVDVMSDTDEFRYATVRNPDGEDPLAGVFDARNALAPEEPSQWWVYWEVEDADATAARAKALGGSVLQEPQDTPYGRMATLADPWGAAFKLRAG